MLEVRLLGKFEIKSDGKLIAIASRPAQSLVAYLILHAGAAHRREKLAGMLWPDSLEETARDNLRHALWRVRKALPLNSTDEYLLTDDLSIAFNASADYRLDAVQLNKISENATSDELMASLSEFQGELLPGFYDEWVMLEREHLDSIFEHQMARLMSLLQDEKRWQDILDWGERWIKLGQKPEPAYRALMSAHAAKGDMSKVAATFERCVKSLKEFSIEPSEQTRALYERLKAGKERFTAEAIVVAEDKRRNPRKTNVPVPITSFVGREKEVEEIVKIVGKNRLVTLAGSGGVGKTRLAIQSSHHLLDKFKDGVWWIDLVGLSDPALVPQAVAKVLDLNEIPSQPLVETLVGAFQTKPVLLVLDNCEHLIIACAQLADRLLGGTKYLKILATSREALDILGETVWLVPSLSLPDLQESQTAKSLGKSESVRLFVERATVIQPKFHLTDENINAVVQICRRLSGMPLAIELAAARIKMMSVDEIARRLDDRFELLTSGSRVALPRHQTLRATVDWSHDLLTEAEKILFRRMAVFAGGFTLEAVEAVCGFGELKPGEILDLLGRMVDKSLIMVELTPMAITRYRMLETIREYAREKSEEADEAVIIQNHHLEYFIELAEEAEQNTFGAESVKYHRRLDQELDDIRTAMEWAIQAHQVTMAFRLGAALFYFWYNRSSIGNEWQRQLNKALLLLEGSERTAARARALNAKGFFYWADVIPDNPRAELEEALSIGRELGDKAIIARSLCNLGLAESVGGNYSEARSLFEQSLQLFGEVDSGKMDHIWSLTFLGDVDFIQGDLPAAQVHYEQVANDLREIRDRNFLAYVVRRLGQLAWYDGEFEKAALLCKESLTLNRELGDERGILANLSSHGGLATARGQAEAAAQLFGAVEALLGHKSIRLVQMDRMEHDRNISVLRTELEETKFEKAWAAGRAMTLEKAIEYALEESRK